VDRDDPVTLVIRFDWRETLTEEILGYLELAGVAISLFAVGVIVVGFTMSIWRYAHRFRDMEAAPNFIRFKVELGSALLLGLEILVLADVIETITVTPTFQSLMVLGAIVIVRTAVSWALTLETEGRWPWQPPQDQVET